MLQQPLLFTDAPVCGLYRITLPDANALLIRWGHRLGPLRRPVVSKAYALLVGQRPVCVAISSTPCSATVAGFARTEAVELARQCADPAEPWANRVMLRLWRETCAQRYLRRPIRAAVSYSKNGMHRGDLYRFDGWEKVAEDAGSSGGGTYSRKRSRDDAVMGAKTLWVWRYADAQQEAA